MADDSSTLSEVDKLRLQLAEAQAQIALLKFEAEKWRLTVAYGLTPADRLDLPSGAITRSGDGPATDH